MSAGRAPRVALLGCRGIPARYGGFETFAEELGTRLVARGFAVTVYCPRPVLGRGEPGPAAHRGVRLEYVRVPPLGPASSLVYDLRALRRARAHHDVVYMLGYGAGAFLRLARRPGNQVWVNMDGLEWRRSKWGPLARTWLRAMERAALRSAERCIFDSAAVRRAVGAEDHPRASVIEYGADLAVEHDPAVLTSLGLRPRGYFLLVARIEPENTVLEILRAHARAPGRLALLLVGDLERAGRYGELCRAAAGPHARFLGSLFDRRTLFSLRRECAAVLHGHTVGGTNPSLLEAMAAGAPVIAHENPFNREVLEDRALYFSGVEDLERALETAAGWSAEERARRGAANRARIVERYTWERIAEEYAALLAGGRPVAAAPVTKPVVDAGALPAPLPRPAARRREEIAP